MAAAALLCVLALLIIMAFWGRSRKREGFRAWRGATPLHIAGPMARYLAGPREWAWRWAPYGSFSPYNPFSGVAASLHRWGV